MVSLVAGIGEEIVFRAVLFGLLDQVIGDFWIAATISAVFFALMHLAQSSLSSIMGLFLVALGLQWLVQISGGLYFAIVVHFLHNLISGIVYGALSEATSADALPKCEGVAPKISAQTSD